MGRNDWHVKADGTLGQGLTNTDELGDVINELSDAMQAAELAERAAKRAQTLKDRQLPMLKGTGFIVIDPANPRFDGEELSELSDAEGHANGIAYRNGVAIIYAPVAVVRPKREVTISTPSKLMQQLQAKQLTEGPVAVVDSAKKG